MSVFSAIISLKGVKSGDIGEFNLVSYNYGVVTPLDKATGMASGRRYMSAIDVEMYVEPKTVRLLSCIYQNEGISGTITFFKQDPDKTKYMTVDIKEGHCIKVEQVFNLNSGNAFLVHIAFSAYAILITAIDGGISAEDTWAQ